MVYPPLTASKQLAQGIITTEEWPAHWNLGRSEIGCKLASPPQIWPSIRTLLSNLAHITH